MTPSLTAEQMTGALRVLETHLDRPVKLIIGGGGAMLLAHHFPLATTDIDGVPAAGITVQELDLLVKKVAQELSLPHDWLNPYYSTFTHVLPSDYGSRLQPVLNLPKLSVLALSKEDLLIMKCFAGRMKDLAHARALVKQGARIALVEKHLEHLRDRRIPGAEKALDFLDEVLG